jgi:hypothetical protein
MDFPKLYPFRELTKKLKAWNIEWDKAKGKGSHGGFVGPDKHGRIQAFPIPDSDQREVRKSYLKGLCRRFELTADDLFSDR